MRAFAIWLAAGLVLGSCTRAEPMACTPPRDNWPKPHNFDGLVPIQNRLSLDRSGALHWNGERISIAKLRTYLRATHQMDPEPFVFLETEMGVSCKALDRVRDEMDKALECGKPYSGCAEGIYSVWRTMPSPPGTPVS
jgi:hypothetical protein